MEQKLEVDHPKAREIPEKNQIRINWKNGAEVIGAN